MLVLAVLPSNPSLEHAVETLCTGTPVCCPQQCCPTPSSSAPTGPQVLRLAPATQEVRARKDLREVEPLPVVQRPPSIAEPVGAVRPSRVDFPSLPLHLRLQRLLI